MRQGYPSRDGQASRYDARKRCETQRVHASGHTVTRTERTRPYDFPSIDTGAE